MDSLGAKELKRRKRRATPCPAPPFKYLFFSFSSGILKNFIYICKYIWPGCVACGTLLQTRGWTRTPCTGSEEAWPPGRPRARLLSGVWLCDPTDCSPPGSSVHGVLQREYWSGLPFPPRESSPPMDGTRVSYTSCIGRGILYHSCHQGNSLNAFFTEQPLCQGTVPN